MRMKNLFLSPKPDFQNFSLQLNIMQKQLRELRDDNIEFKKRLTQIANLVTGSTIVEREDEYPEEERNDHVDPSKRGS